MAASPPLPIARILECLRADDVDGAIEAGLMSVDPGAAVDAGSRAGLLAAQQRLARAWAARDRHLARAARLERAARERAARRRAAPVPDGGTGKAALPAAAARALARAKARAEGKQ